MLGQVGISKTELRYWTLREIVNAVRGLNDLQRQRIKQEWEQARAIATVTANTFSEEEISAGKLMPFEWDHEDQEASISDDLPSLEEAKQMSKKHQQIKNEGTTTEAL